MGGLVETQSEITGALFAAGHGALVSIAGLRCDHKRVILPDAVPREIKNVENHNALLSAADNLSIDAQTRSQFEIHTCAPLIDKQEPVPASAAAEIAAMDVLAQPVLGTHSMAAASRDLVAIMTLPSGQAQPQERLFAGDALVGILPHLHASELTNLTRTVARLELVSDRLRTFLATHDDNDISCRMLKDAHNLSDADLLKIITKGSEQQMRLIARRRLLGVVVCDAIIRSGNPAAILDLLRNQESQLSGEAFAKLPSIVQGRGDLESALCNRADLPQAVGLQMFWQVGQNLRRYILSRFLTESAALGRVMETGMAAGAIPPLGGQASASEIELLVTQIENGDSQAAVTLARCCRVAPETAERIVSDTGGEPMAVVFKSLAQSRLAMAEALKRWLASDKCKIKGENRLIELHAQFDSLSYNKARMLLSYWDWYSREAGPYTLIAD